MLNKVKKGFTEQLEAAQLALDNLWRLTECDLPSVIEVSSRWQNANPREVALSIFHSRRARAKHFGNRNIFGEPAWDILLDLYIHQAEGEQISIKSASIGSCAPATTALRWLKTLEEEALVVSVEDPNDQRRRFVQLTAEGYEVLTRYFHDIAG